MVMKELIYNSDNKINWRKLKETLNKMVVNLAFKKLKRKPMLREVVPHYKVFSRKCCLIRIHLSSESVDVIW